MAARQSDRIGTTHSADDPLVWERTHAFLRYSIGFIIVGGSGVAIAIRLLAPDQSVRALMVTAFVAVGVVAAGLLAAGRTRASFLVQAMGIWTYITVAGYFFGGVDAVSVYIYPLIILMLGWLASPRAALLLASLSSGVTLAYALGEVVGLLPSPPTTSPVLRWLVDSCVLPRRGARHQAAAFVRQPTRGCAAAQYLRRGSERRGAGS